MKKKILLGLILSSFLKVVLGDVSNNFSEKIEEQSIEMEKIKILDEILKINPPVSPNVIDVTDTLDKYFEINMSKEHVLMILKREGFLEKNIKPWNGKNTIIATYPYGLDGKAIFPIYNLGVFFYFSEQEKLIKTEATVANIY